MWNNIRWFVRACQNDRKRDGCETIASAYRVPNRTGLEKRLARIIAGVCAGITTMILAGCSGGGTPGTPAPQGDLAHSISSVTVDGRGASLYVPATLPMGIGNMPVLTQSAVLQPDSAHPDGQIELQLTVNGTGGLSTDVLVGAPGVIGYYEAPFLADSSPGARTITPSSFTPGQTLHVSIRLTDTNPPSLSGAEDTPPTGWTVSNVSSPGQYDSSTGTINWFPAGPFPRTVSYDVTDPTYATFPAGFVGSAYGGGAEDSYSELLSGDQFAAPAGVRAAGAVATPKADSKVSPAPGRNSTHRAPPPPYDTVEISPTVPAAQFNADLFIEINPPSEPLTIHIRNGSVSTTPLDVAVSTP